jgi:hypothetical protein
VPEWNALVMRTVSDDLVAALGANHPNQPYAMIAARMPEVRLHNGTMLRSEDIDHATFWEKGSNSGIKPVGGDRLPVEDDRLHIVLKHSTSSKHFITGQDALDDLKALEAADVRILYRRQFKVL